jgi:hypothetical protein
MDNEAPSVAPVRVNNPDRSPFGINRCNASPTLSGFAESVGDDFPPLHATIMRGSDEAGNVIETQEQPGDFKGP